MNIVDLITSQLGGDVLSKLSGQIGATESQTKSAVGAAVPALLGSLSKLAGTPSGAKQITSAMDGLDLGMLGNLASAFTGGGASKTSDLGGKLLGSLLGGGGTSSLVSALASLVGLNSGVTKMLLSFLAPVVLGNIAKQFKGAPDASSLTRFFSDQQSNITGALPKGFSLGDFASEGVKSVVNEGAKAVQKHSHSHSAPVQSSGLPSWLPLAALAALLGALGYFLFMRPSKPVDRGPLAGGANPTLPAGGAPAGMQPAAPVTPEAPAEIALPAVPEIKLPEAAADLLAGLPIGKDLGGLFGDLTKTLSGVTDEATAKAALPTLEGFGPSLEAITKAAGALTAEQKGSVGKMVTEQMGPLQKIIDTVMGLPGVKDILGPVVVPMIEAIGKLGA